MAKPEKKNKIAKSNGTANKEALNGKKVIRFGDKHLDRLFSREYQPDGRGRPKLTDIEKQARDVAREEIARWLLFLKNVDYDDFMKIDLGKCSALDAWFLGTVRQGIIERDTSELHRMFNRIIGVPKPEDENSRFPTITDSQVVIQMLAPPSEKSIMPGEGETVIQAETVAEALPEGEPKGL